MGSTCGIHIEEFLPQCCSGTGLLTPTDPRSHGRYCGTRQHLAFSYEINKMKCSSSYCTSRRMPFCRCSSGYYNTNWPMCKCDYTCISHLGLCTAEWPLKKKIGSQLRTLYIAYVMSFLWYSILLLLGRGRLPNLEFGIGQFRRVNFTSFLAG